MGYNTDFKGQLEFTQELTVKQLAKLGEMLGEDCRDHPEWGHGDDLSYIDLELTKGYDGLKWNGSEKTYDLEKKVNVVITEMRKLWPDFGLKGQMIAQGEDLSDRWALVIGEDGFAAKRPLAITGKVVECPHCGDKFMLEGSEE